MTIATSSIIIGIIDLYNYVLLSIPYSITFTPIYYLVVYYYNK